ncbi:MAG: phage tail tape measure protein [Colwellia sp.]|nr:phage tail tape measure protein [Colwellia sp.]
MAANTIKGSEAVKQLTDLYANLAAQIDKATQETKDFLSTTQKLPSQYIGALNQLNQTQKEYTTTLETTTKKQKEVTAEQKESARIANEKIKIEAKLSQATSKEAQELAKLRVELQKVNKSEKENAELSSRLTSEYRKQSIILNQLRAKYKDVALVQGESSKEAKRLAAQVTVLDAKLKKVDAAAGQFGRNVGNYPKQLGGAVRSLKSFAAAFGFTSAVFILAQTVKNAVGIFKDFDQAQADLAAILGRNKNDISALTEQAKELGATTAFTATQVSELQLELAKLGFTDTQILEATLGIENLAIATGVDAARAAKLGGAALRGFGLEASKANEVAATLAVSTTKSALTFEALETSLPKVSAIAKSFGFTIEDTTALLGGLQNAGFEASIAGTSLRQIFLQLADSNGKLAKRLGGGAKDFDQLIDQFKKVEEEGISLGEAFGLTNARSVAAFKVFLSGAEDMRTLRDSIVDVETELDVLAEQKLDSVQGRITLLNSAWQGWIINLDSSGDAAKNVKSALEFLTKNLDKILNTIVKVGKAFLIYKAILIGTSLITKLYTAATTALKIAQIALSGGIKAARIEMQALNIATKANPIGILLSVLAAGVAIWLAFKDGVSDTADEMKRLKEESDNATKAIIDNTITQVQAQIALVDLQAETQKKANEEKITLLNENIKAQEEGTASMYDNLDEISKIGEEAINKTLEEKLAERSKLLADYYNGLEDFAAGKIKELPIFPEFAPISSEEKKSIDERGSTRTEAEEKIIERLKAMRKKFITDLGKITDDEEKKANAKAVKLRQKIAEQEIQNDINVQKRIIANKENSNRAIIIAIKERIRLEMQLEKLRTQFVIDNADSTTEERALAELKLQDKLTQIIIKGQNDRAAAAKRDETDTSLKDEDIGIDTRLVLIDALVEAGQGTFEELAKLYDDDLDAFLKLAQAKLNITKQFSEAQIEAVQDAFSSFGEMYGIDGSKFVKLFEQKEITTAEYADIALEASQGLVNAFSHDYNVDLANLQKKEELALEGVGDNVAAQEEIRRQFAEKEAEIRRKQAKAERDQAIFSIIVNTAQGIIKTIANVGLPPAIPLIAAIGAIGAIQVATVASRPLPEFKDGVRDFSGGKAILGDGGVSEYAVLPNKKVIKTPSTDTVYDLPKGTDVLKNENEFTKYLNKELSFNGILPSVERYRPVNQQTNSLSESTFTSEMNKLRRTIDNGESSQIIFDEYGYSKYQKRDKARVKKLNNRFTGRGRKV